MRPPPLSGWRLQVAVLLVAGALWAIYPEATLLALVLAYLAAWLLLSVAGARRIRIGGRAAAVVALLLAVAPLAQAASLVRRFAENEGWVGLPHLVESRRALARTPTVYPRLLSLDRRQTFYVHAPGAERAALEVGRLREEGEALGHGLFRVELDPHPTWYADEPAAAVGEVTAEIVLDAGSDRTAVVMQVVQPAAHPRWLSPSPDRLRAAAVSEETDELYVVSADEPPVVHSTSDGPVGAVFVADDRVAVAHRYASTVLLLDVGDRESGREILVGPGGTSIAASPDRRRLAVTRDSVSPELVLIDLGPATGPVPEPRLTRVPLSFRPDRVAFGGDAQTVIVTSRRPAAIHRVVDGEVGDDPIVLSRPVVALSAGGPTLFAAVTDYRADGREHHGNHFVEDTLLTVDVARWRVTEARPTATRTARQRSPGDLDRGVSPMGIDLAPDGSLWVAFAGTDDVARYVPGEPLPRRIRLDEHPLAAPHSAVALARGAYAVSSPIYGAIGVFDRRGERIALARFAPDDQTLLREDEEALKRRIGERTFYEGTRSGVSCQSCHLHGGSDGARHNIGGSTLVATLDVRGIAGTPPYLRDGGYPTLGSLDDVAQTLYRGYRRRQGGRRPGLDAYLASLAAEPPRRQLEERDVARERRGLDAFVEARCVVCHAFPAFTNLSQHAAEWMFPGREGNEAAHELDTPSLLRLDRSAPYLVDGRAQTIESVLVDHDPARRHGAWRALDDDALADLVYLLEGL